MRDHDPDKLIDFLVGYGFEEARRDDEWESEFCPLCQAAEKKGRIWVNVQRGFVNCYSCGGRKNIFQWVMDVEGCTFREAQALVGEGEEKHHDADLIHHVFVPEETDVAGLRWPALPVHEVAWLSSGGDPAGWGLAAVEAVAQRGFNLEWMRAKACGLGCDGRWAGRVILPAFHRNQLVWWQGWDWTRTLEIKYDSPPTSKDCLGRRHTLYQWDIYGGADQVVLAEGVFNAWAAEQVGYPAIASFGKALSSEQMALLLASPVRDVVVAFDRDAADRACAVAWDLIEIGKRARVVSYPDDRDLNDHPLESRRSLLDRASPPDWFPKSVTTPRSLRESLVTTAQSL